MSTANAAGDNRRSDISSSEYGITDDITPMARPSTGFDRHSDAELGAREPVLTP